MPQDYSPTQPLRRLDGTVDRRRFLVEEARGRRVVHLGCVDDRLTERRLGEGQLLHARLAEVASTLVGVDISQAGIELLRTRVPGDYLVGDVEQLHEIPLPIEVDLVIASELIEHLGRPQAFLEGLRGYLVSTGAEAIITTPNAFGWTAFFTLALRRREPSHPDHVLLFSPFTLNRALDRAGLSIADFWVHDWDRGSGLGQRLRSLVTAAVRRWNPYLGVGLVARVRVG